jgi:protein-S-isoprenylcysteine O-methyltransferase Ste14
MTLKMLVNQVFLATLTANSPVILIIAIFFLFNPSLFIYKEERRLREESRSKKGRRQTIS